MNDSDKLEVLKNNVVTQLFVDAADEDYVFARSSHHWGMYFGFFWSGGQAIEKYLKASLLLNGQSSKGYSHGLIRLYNEVCNYAGDLLPDRLSMPQQLNCSHWTDETPLEFLERIENFVSPDNRYKIFGVVSAREDLFHLDQLIFALRRIAFDLSAFPFIGRNDGTGPQTVRVLLERTSSYSPRQGSSRFYKLIADEKFPERTKAALKLNFPFAPDDFNHDEGGIRIGHSMSQSVLYTRIMSVADRNDGLRPDRDAADLAEWVVENIQMSREVAEELRNAIPNLRLVGSGSGLN